MLAFMRAMDAYKRNNRRPFPTWCEVLDVMYSLGYRPVAVPGELPVYQPARSNAMQGPRDHA